MNDAAGLLAILREHGLKLGVAESCTGGMLGAALTDIPGSSDTFYGGVIAYHDDVKTKVLGLDPDKLAKHGAVSGWAVELMADAIRRQMGCDMAIAISGVAGPGGGSAKKPVGTVWIGIEGPEHLMDVARHDFEGSRDDIRQQAVQAALRRAVEMVQEAELEGVA